MADAATAVVPTIRSREFLWRRLHSLSGVVPVGLFLCYHVFENLSALRGPEAYDEMINHVNALLPRTFFYALELVGIIVPLLFHAFYGAWLSFTGKPNVGRYAYASNWSYLMQRVSGYVAFLFLLVHVGTLRTYVTLGGHHLAAVDPPKPGGLDIVTYKDVAVHLGNTTWQATHSLLAGDHILVLYVLGTLFTIYHFTNGLRGFCWTWGIAVGRVAQRRVTQGGWALFLALSLATLSILVKLRFSGLA